MSASHIFHSPTPLLLECGETLHQWELAYHTYGRMNERGDNVVWICHALTANSDAAAWWPGLVGPGCLFDPAEHFIVCANMLGSCYGSTSALSVNPVSGEPYYHDFPNVTVRDMVRALDRLRLSLGISQIKVLIGGSMGGQQALEWAVQRPELFEYFVPMATNAKHSAWGIAFNESQRLAIQADATWQERHPRAGAAGLKAARAIAMLSYRNYDTYCAAQSDDTDRLEGYRAASYQAYQGQKLVDRFNAFSYVALSKAMDSHHLGRERGGVEAALSRIGARTLVIGISSDLLFPIEEQMYLAEHIPGADFACIDSMYGHDGFLIEFETLEKHLRRFFRKHEGQAARRA
jgi:homoserine O-acetyltransferase